MSKAEDWLIEQTNNHRNTPRWFSKGAFNAWAELHYRGPGSAALVKLTSNTDVIVLAPVDARSLAEWLLEMYGE